MRKPVVIVICLLLKALGATSQSTYLPSDHLWHDFIRRVEIKSGGTSGNLHLLFKPIERKAMVEFLQHADSVSGNLSSTDRAMIKFISQSNPEWSNTADNSKEKASGRYFYRHKGDFFRYHDTDFFLVLNPVLQFEMGHEKDNDNLLYLNSRGVEVRGMINKKIGFYSYITDNQARYPMYLREKIASQQGAIPGYGWNIPFKDGGYDYFNGKGYIAFQATKNIGIQFGQDRNFIGYGNRSLLLSDYSNNYLFLKLNTNIWRIQYQNLFARLVDYPQRSYGGRIYDAKYMAAHTLSINISKRFQLGLFENVVFGRTDTLSKRGFDAHYLNPVIFYRAMEHHIGDPDKVSLGMTWRWIAGRRVAFHGQVYMDDFLLSDVKNDLDSLLVKLGLRSERKYTNYASFMNKFGLQLGLNHVDFLGIKNLDLNLEANWVRPFTYTHYDTSGAGMAPSANYLHYGQSLAHPLGANFSEFIVDLQYQPHRNWILKSTLISARQGMDFNGVNMGGDISRDYTTRQGDYGHIFLQGEKRKALLLNAELSWQWYPGMWLDARYMVRNELISQQTNKTGIYSLGIRVNAVARRNWF